MLVIADSSPLRYLTVVGLPDLLPAIFGEVWIPSAVLEELSADATPEPVRALVARRPPWLRTRDPKPETMAAFAADLHHGERAALALALELNADLVLVDDAAGRREAKSLGIRVTGTLGVLRLAAERGLIDVRQVVTGLRDSGFYAGEALLQQAFGPWL